MRRFICKACGGVQFSAAALENQTTPECIYCGSTEVEEADINDVKQND